MKISTTVSLDEELLEGARAFARSERRSLSAQIEAWIEEKLMPDEAASPVKPLCAAAAARPGRTETPHHLTPNPDADLTKRAVVKVSDQPHTKGGGR
jgi:hypothetical protein